MNFINYIFILLLKLIQHFFSSKIFKIITFMGIKKNIYKIIKMNIIQKEAILTIF